MSTINLLGQRVLIAGASKFLGEAVASVLEKRGAEVFKINRANCNLLNYDETYYQFSDIKPDYCLNLVTYSGNVQFNQKFPAETFFFTTQMILNVLWSCHIHNVKKVVSIISSCALADFGSKVLEETDLWAGKPNPSIESHGFAKRNIDAFNRQLRKQFNMNAVSCILQNLMGPEDSTDLSKTKVVMSLIKKFVDAKRNGRDTVTLFGTGEPLREFVYRDDAAEAIVQVLERYNEELPINIASDYEISIKDLACKISNYVGYTGETIFDPTYGDGQRRKKLNTQRMIQYLDVKFTPFDVALLKTIKWYESLLS